MNLGDLVIVKLPVACPPSIRQLWDNKTGFVVREGRRGGLKVLWIYVAGVGVGSFEPGSLRALT